MFSNELNGLLLDKQNKRLFIFDNSSNIYILKFELVSLYNLKLSI